MLFRSDADSTISQRGELEEIIVLSTRTKSKGDLSSQSYTQEELNKSNTGVNLPYLLQSSPSLVVTSDDGLGIGYTYFRIRGTDHTRINMTVNGVPLNDSESQTVFWVNMTDMASSMESVDVQRGVGSSTNGQAAFGASVNMQSEKSGMDPYAELFFNGGMYNTFREGVKLGTGLLNDHFAFDARFTKVNTDGYVRRAFSDLYSYYASGSYYGNSTVVKLMAFGGKERTYMAWDGINEEMLETDRRFNPAGLYFDENGDTAFYHNQTDNYAQQHYQLHVTQQLPYHLTLNGALHYTHGSGYYEQYKADSKLSKYGIPTYINEDGNEVKRSDLVRQKHLYNHFYGGVLALSYTTAKLQATIGGGLNNYVGDHYGNVTWLRTYAQPLDKDYEYYRNQGEKLDGNIYLKANWEFVKGLSVYADMQYRYIDYKINGINDEDLQAIHVQKYYHFFNPKAGLSYLNGAHTAYARFAIANREPGRNNFMESGPHDIPKAERLYDYELGYQYKQRIVDVSANLYLMWYHDQLVLTGQYSDVGAYLTKNVEQSYRAGIELMVGFNIAKWLRWDLNATLSRNKIINFTDWVDDWNADWSDPQVVEYEGQVEVQYGNTNISFSPSITAGSRIQFMMAGFGAALQTNYVGKQYLDNTSNPNAMLKGYCISNLNLSYKVPVKKVIKELTLQVQLNNLFNTLYVNNGGVYGYFEGADEQGKFNAKDQKFIPWYYAQAGFNIHGGFSLLF